MNEQQKVQRYEPSGPGFGGVRQADDGDFVLYCDYDQLRQRLAEVEAITDNLRAERLREFDRAERNHADANRYRYLRVDGVPQLCVVVNGVPSYIDDPDGSSLDAFIDAAIEADAAIASQGD